MRQLKAILLNKLAVTGQETTVIIIWERVSKKTEVEKIQTKKINHFCSRGCKLKTSLFFHPPFYFCSHTPPSFTWILRTKSLATGFGCGWDGGKGKSVVYGFSYVNKLIPWQPLKKKGWKQKPPPERGSVLFHGRCKNNSRDSLLWKVSDGR